MAGGKKSGPIVVAQIMGKWVGGGVEAVIMNYYRHIDRTKVQFDFICDEDSTNIPYKEIERLGGHVILCPPYQKLFKYMKFLENLFREKKYRIVHSNINTLSVFPLNAAKKAGVPVRIAHSHSTSNPREWKKNLMKNALRPFSKVWATDYFACTKHAGEYQFGKKAVEQGKVKIITNAIDIEKFKFDPEARKRLRKEFGFKDSDYVIGNFGRLIPQKNQLFLIDAFAEFKKENPNAKLLIVGEGDLLSKIQEKITSYGLTNDVRIEGFRKDLNKCYSALDLFAFPSIYEGLGMVAVEAQVNGLSVVASEFVPDEANIGSMSKVELAEGYLKRYLRNDTKINASKYDISNLSSELQRKYELFILEKARMRVLWTGMSANMGGIETFLINYYKSIRNKNIQIDFVDAYDKKMIFRKEIKDSNGRVYDIPSEVKHPFLCILALRKIILRNSYSIVHINKNSVSLLPILVAAKLGRAPVRIIHSHNTKSNSGKVADALHNINKHFIKLFCNSYYACSEEAAKWMFPNSILRKHQYKIIKNAIDTKKFKFDPEARKKLRKEIGIADGDFVIGHIGRFVEQKNHRFLIYVFAEVKKEKKNAKLVLVGQGPLREEIEQKVKDLGLEKDVFFLGQRSDTNKLYSVFDVFCLPSLYEGLPVVGVEAQANGVKCILSSTISNEVLSSSSCEFIDINDSHEWLAQICNCSLKQQERKITVNSALAGMDIVNNAKILLVDYLNKKEYSKNE